MTISEYSIPRGCSATLRITSDAVAVGVHPDPHNEYTIILVVLEGNGAYVDRKFTCVYQGAYLRDHHDVYVGAVSLVGMIYHVIEEREDQ